MHAGKLLLHARHDAAHIDAGAPARRAGYVLHAVGAQAHVLQNLDARRRLQARIARQRHADGVADAVEQQRADADGALDAPLLRQARLRDAQVQRIVARFAGQPVGRDGVRHVARLHGEHHIVKPAALQHARVAERALDHALRRRSAVLLQDVLLHRAGVDADAYRDVVRLHAVRQHAHVLLPANVAGIDAQLVDAVLHRRQRQLVVKVNVGDQRHRAAVHQRAHGFRARLVVHGDADDVRARDRQRADLRERRLHVRRVRIGHRLHGNRRAAADEHAAGLHLPGLLRHSRFSFFLRHFTKICMMSL